MTAPSAAAQAPAIDPEAFLIASGPTKVDGSPVRAPVVVTEQGDMVAVWQIDLLGTPCGAWVMPFEGESTARRLLAQCDRRGLITVDPAEPVELLGRWAREAGIQLDREVLTARVCTLPTLLEQTNEARTVWAAAIAEAEQRHNKRLAPLEWTRPVPDPIPTTVAELERASSVRVTSGDSDGRPALLVARLAQWAIQLWVDTEAKRARRPYLRQPFGPTQPLPSSWRAALKNAYQSPFQL